MNPRTDRNHWETLEQENRRRRALGLDPRTIRPPHPADDRRRAEHWLSFLGFLLAMLTVAAMLAVIHGF